jgi:hypothetical protein
MPGDSERALGGLSAAGKVDERDLQTSGRSQSLTGAVLCTIMCDVATRACSSADRAADFESDGRGFESLQARLVCPDGSIVTCSRFAVPVSSNVVAPLSHQGEH